MWTKGLVRFAAVAPLLLSAAAAQSNSPSSCDLNADGIVDTIDVDLATRMSLGTARCLANIAGPGICNAVVVQRVINASLGRPCVLSNGSHAVTLTWIASSSPEVAGYRVHRSATAGGPYATLNAALVLPTSYVDTTVEAGKTYFYVVTAVDKSGTSSTYSNEASGIVPKP